MALTVNNTGRCAALTTTKGLKVGQRNGNWNQSCGGNALDLIFKGDENMTDNELIAKLQSDVIDAINASKMPLMVKAIVLENVLLKVNASIKTEDEKQQETSSEPEQKE